MSFSLSSSSAPLPLLLGSLTGEGEEPPLLLLSRSWLAMLALPSPPPDAVSVLFHQTIRHPCFSIQYHLRFQHFSLPSPSPLRCCSCSFSSLYSSSFSLPCSDFYSSSSLLCCSFSSCDH